VSPGARILKPRTIKILARPRKTPPEAEIDRLYGLPPDQFTAARDAAAKKLRAEGRREAGERVKGLRKPTAPAWAVNQLARGRGGRLDDLLAVGRELRDAQKRLVGGKEKAGGDVRDLSARERGLVRELTGEARALLREHGAAAGEGSLDDVAETLHAAALDEQTAAEVAEGRLTRGRQAIGLGLSGAPAPRSKRSAAKQPPARKRTEAAEARLRAARTSAREARQAVESAARAVRSAESELGRAKRSAERAAERERKAAEALERLRG
jgi:hypothetical protein